MSESQHSDLFQEAMQGAVRDAAQFASLVVTAGRVFLQYKLSRERLRAQRDAQARRALQAQVRAEQAAARARWAPAGDRSWLRGAALLDVAAVWSAAVPYADPAGQRFERSAQSAVQNCESRLRELHTYAMARYDRLRADGMGPIDAMQESVRLFARPAESYAQPAKVRLALVPGDGLGHSWVESAEVHRPTREDLETELQRRRGAQILDRLQARAARDGQQPLDADEQYSALESRTNLAPTLIPRAVQPVPAASATPRRHWKQEFPFPITDVVAAAATHGNVQPAVAPRRPDRPSRPAASSRMST
jgi:hypothetical protein